MGGNNQRDISIPGNISLRQSQINFIDKYRVGRGYKNRSDYVQFIIDKDIKYRRFELFAEFSSYLILPMMGFFFFLLISVITTGLIFYIFMSIFGAFAVFLSFVYYAKNKVKIEKQR